VPEPAGRVVAGLIRSEHLTAYAGAQFIDLAALQGERLAVEADCGHVGGAGGEQMPAGNGDGGECREAGCEHGSSFHGSPRKEACVRGGAGTEAEVKWVKTSDLNVGCYPTTLQKRTAVWRHPKRASTGWRRGCRGPWEVPAEPSGHSTVK